MNISNTLLRYILGAIVVTAAILILVKKPLGTIAPTDTYNSNYPSQTQNPVQNQPTGTTPTNSNTGGIAAVTLDMTNSYAKTYSTRFSSEFAQPANYDGHFRVVDIGCGAGCFTLYALDKNTGKTYLIANGKEDYQLRGNTIMLINQNGKQETYTFDATKDKFTLMAS